MISVNMVGANVYQVVLEGSQAQYHRVTLSPSFYQVLCGRTNTQEWVLMHAFRLLIERQGREHIAETFDLSELSRQYPDFVCEMHRRLSYVPCV
ncbi:MAG TPA: hypothetical protein DCP57_05615 [Gammaproteobacteria bacterium]|jgi:hypothetical protein|nr:hypothetical protein [Gammaproteobacteria bacterium]|tara:strand:+ start:264 stop:545 length:282 start_codon:yes stop_codon:yes gene_type:complete